MVETGGSVPIYYFNILTLDCFNISEILTDLIPQVINHSDILNLIEH